MSYSRWSNSRWYTFHHVESGESLEDQVFATYDAAGQARNYDYDTLKGITIPQLRELGRPYEKEPTDAELAELLRYVEEWLSDVEQEPEGEP